MKLKDNFFHIVDAGDMTRKVAFNSDHEIYKAHFPGNPITPGVCLVQMATEMLQDIFHASLSLTELSRIKYRGIVKPEDSPTFRFSTMQDNAPSPSGVRLLSGGENLKVKVVIEGDNSKVFTEMTLVYKVDA